MTDHDKLREALDQVEKSKKSYTGVLDPTTAYMGVWLRHFDTIMAAARSTLPKTKMVSVWRCEYSVLASALNWAPCVFGYLTKEDADEAAARMSNNERYRCIRVTGPHQQEVPA